MNKITSFILCLIAPLFSIAQYLVQPEYPLSSIDLTLGQVWQVGITGTPSSSGEIMLLTVSLNDEQNRLVYKARTSEFVMMTNHLSAGQGTTSIFFPTIEEYIEDNFKAQLATNGNRLPPLAYRITYKLFSGKKGGDGRQLLDEAEFDLMGMPSEAPVLVNPTDGAAFTGSVPLVWSTLPGTTSNVSVYCIGQGQTAAEAVAGDAPIWNAVGTTQNAVEVPINELTGMNSGCTSFAWTVTNSNGTRSEIATFTATQPKLKEEEVKKMMNKSKTVTYIEAKESGKWGVAFGETEELNFCLKGYPKLTEKDIKFELRDSRGKLMLSQTDGIKALKDMKFNQFALYLADLGISLSKGNYKFYVGVQSDAILTKGFIINIQ